MQSLLSLSQLFSDTAHLPFPFCLTPTQSMPVYVCPIFLCVQLSTGVLLTYQGFYLQKELILSAPGPRTCQQFLDWGQNFMPSSPLRAEIWSGLGLYRSCAQGQNQGGFIYVGILLCLEHSFLVVAHHLYLLCPFFYSEMIPESLEESVQYLCSIQRWVFLFSDRSQLQVFVFLMQFS